MTCTYCYYSLVSIFLVTKLYKRAFFSRKWFEMSNVSAQSARVVTSVWIKESVISWFGFCRLNRQLQLPENWPESSRLRFLCYWVDGFAAWSRQREIIRFQGDQAISPEFLRWNSFNYDTRVFRAVLSFVLARFMASYVAFAGAEGPGKTKPLMLQRTLSIHNHQVQTRSGTGNDVNGLKLRQAPMRLYWKGKYHKRRELT